MCITLKFENTSKHLKCEEETPITTVVLLCYLCSCAETMSCTNKRKLFAKTLSVKYEALKKIERGVPKKVVAAEYNVPRNTISTWLKNKEKIVKAFEGGNNRSSQKLKSSNYDNLDQAVYMWFVKTRDEGIPVNGPVLKEKAIQYSKDWAYGKFQSIKWLV